MKDIKPINSKRSYNEALREIETLMSAPNRSPEADRLEVLAILVSTYEAEHHPIEAPAPNDAVIFRMEQAGYNRNDLAELLDIGTGRVSELLRGKRPFTLEMVRTLHERWGIPLEALVLHPSRPRPAQKAGRKRRTPAGSKRIASPRIGTKRRSEPTASPRKQSGRATIPSRKK